ncbi:hypothetical protein ACFSSC_09030 [Corynebacterium mendelii]|uniref:Uncharacterized protein n=1 Tax=Corynebacterium mendelii TaxID=2765362 RepID=A0A939E299_9CORY|nr:hypothetical protein [Corynebacterium mendelii]MBN9645119.1 hypothetical protein [Corynebacterium mendelii]
MTRYAPVIKRDHGRMLYRDHKPYFAPDSLDDLTGPAQGIFILPHSVRWQNEKVRTFDVTVDVERRCAYRDLISEGTDEQQCEFINKELLIQDFPHIFLAERAYKLWKDSFPELAQDG